MSAEIEISVSGTKEDWSRLACLLRLWETSDILQSIADEIERVLSDESCGELVLPLVDRVSGQN